MKALTIKQPWADLILFHGKRIENRTWKPPKDIIGQRIAIHTGKRTDKEAERRFEDIIIVPRQPPLGCIVGTCRVVECVTASDSEWFEGPFGWVLDEVRPLKKILPCKGSLKLWNVPRRIEISLVTEIALEKYNSTLKLLEDS